MANYTHSSVHIKNALVILIENNYNKRCVKSALNSYFKNPNSETLNFLSNLNYDFWIPIEEKKLDTQEVEKNLKLRLENFKLKHIVCVGKAVINMVPEFDIKNLITYPFYRGDGDNASNAYVKNILSSQILFETTTKVDQ